MTTAEARWTPGRRRPPPAATPAGAGIEDTYGDPDPEWLRVDWRRRLRRTEVVGTEVSYVEMGEGSPLVFVHGLSGCWQNWLENIPHFARSNRVLALDLPGFGGSPLPSWEISIPAYGRFLHDFCERLGLGRCAVVGNSMGGFIATELAINEPHRVDRLGLVSAAGITYASLRREPAEVLGRLSRAAGPAAFKFQKGGMRRHRLRRIAFRGVFHRPDLLRPELVWENLVPAVNSPGFLSALTSLVGYDIRHRLEEIEVPTLIVWGRNDRLVPAAAADAYQRRIGDNARRVIFDQTGHAPQLERPARFNRLLEAFLDEDSPSSRAGRAPH